MRKPDAHKKAESLENAFQTWVDTTVRKYLQHLLDQVQPRLRRPIHYHQNQQFDHLYVGDTDLLDLAHVSSRGKNRARGLIQRWLPEVILFKEMLDELSDVRDNPWVGDIKATVKPRKHPRRDVSGRDVSRSHRRS